MRLKGKRAVVTAAGAGIGQATALAYLAEGAHVIAADIDYGSMTPVAEAGGEMHHLDVTDDAAVAAFARNAGAVDVLFNCAGFVHHGTILDCAPEEFDASWRLNVRAMYQMTSALLPAMLENGGGSIVNMSSAVSSIIAAPNRFAYGATKAAVIGLTKSVAADFVTQGIRANAICPGTVESPSWHARVKAQGEAIGDVEKARADFIARQPMGRIATAGEIAKLAVYLASDESAFMTGEALVIDGGWSNV